MVRARMANVIEEAKSGRASCRTCRQPIAKGELRLGIEAVTQFSDAPSLQWHHLACAAGKLPAELKDALAAYAGDVPDRAALDAAMAEAIAKGAAKPGGIPFVDRAPTGRARCLQCGAPIEKASYRVAVERELDTAAFQARGPGFLHPRCAAANVAASGGTVDELVAAVTQNSRVPADELERVIGEITAGSGDVG